MKKYRLQDMSWMEAQEAFQRSDTVVVPVGTLHAHGPIPIGIDARSVEKLSEEVGKRTGLMVLPVLAYGENDKMKDYPGSITIGQDVIEVVQAMDPEQDEENRKHHDRSNRVSFRSEAG